LELIVRFTDRGQDGLTVDLEAAYRIEAAMNPKPS